MYSSITQGIATIWRTEGLLGFYQGYFSICLRDVPFTMLELGLYENLSVLPASCYLHDRACPFGRDRSAPPPLLFTTC